MSNLSAFLGVIRHSEGTDRATNPYAVCFGYKFTITDFSDHPTAMGLWKGEPLDSLGPEYVGKHSTAAGAYQLILPTWQRLKAKLGLIDFTPPSQDAAAIELMREVGAVNLIQSGQVANAINACHGIWASLPGSTSCQPQASLASLVSFYTGSGGAFA